MRDQYAGDISDLLKYALLRTLARDDYRLGVAWYYNQNYDGRPDGKHIEYSQWRFIDEPLWNELAGFCKAFHDCNDLRMVRNLEKLSFWPPSTIFHGTENGEAVPKFKRDRRNWIIELREKIGGCRLVFLDPDNSVHLKASTRHATYSDVAALREGDRALLCIKFPARVNFDEQLRDFHDSLKHLGGARCAITLRTRTAFRSASGVGSVFRFRWFTLIDFDRELEMRFRQFAERINELEGVQGQVYSLG